MTDPIAKNERPILFNGAMVAAILAGRKTQTRRIVKPQHEWVSMPYGLPGEYLYDGSHDKSPQWRQSTADTRGSERGLHGRGGRSDIQPNEVCWLREEGFSGLVSTGGAFDSEGIPEHQHVSSKQEGDKERSSLDLLGISRRADDKDGSGPAPGRGPQQQRTEQPSMGEPIRELAVPESAWSRNRWGEASSCQAIGCGAESYSLVRRDGIVQRSAGGSRSGHESVGNFQDHFKVGCHRLWVRETWALVPASAYRCSEGVQQIVNPADPDMAAVYAAGWDRSRPGRWSPSIHMPRWASRITLEITDVRVQQLEDISEYDAVAEGLKVFDRGTGSRLFVFPGSPYDQSGLCHSDAGIAYCEGWEQSYGRDSRDANPWVWVVEFKRVESANV